MPYGAPSSPAIRARRLLLVMPVTAHKVTHRTPARAWTRESPKRRCPPNRVKRMLDDYSRRHPD